MRWRPSRLFSFAEELKKDMKRASACDQGIAGLALF